MPCRWRIWRYSLQVAARLPHEPHGPHVGRAAPAGVQETARHWSHAHGCSILVFAEEHAKICWLMFGRPLAAIDEIGLRPRFAVDGAGGHHGNREAALRRIAGAGVHDVGVDFAFGAEKFLVAAGSGHRHVLQKDLRRGLAGVAGVLDFDAPAARLRRAARPTRKCCFPNPPRARYEPLSVSKHPPCDPRHSPCRCRPGPVPRPAGRTRPSARPRPAGHAGSPTLVMAASTSARWGRWPVPL